MKPSYYYQARRKKKGLFTYLPSFHAEGKGAFHSADSGKGGGKGKQRPRRYTRERKGIPSLSHNAEREERKRKKAGLRARALFSPFFPPREKKRGDGRGYGRRTRLHLPVRAGLPNKKEKKRALPSLRRLLAPGEKANNFCERSSLHRGKPAFCCLAFSSRTGREKHFPFLFLQGGGIFSSSLFLLIREEGRPVHFFSSPFATFFLGRGRKEEAACQENRGARSNPRLGVPGEGGRGGRGWPWWFEIRPGRPVIISPEAGRKGMWLIHSSISLLSFLSSPFSPSPSVHGKKREAALCRPCLLWSRAPAFRRLLVLKEKERHALATAGGPGGPACIAFPQVEEKEEGISVITNVLSFTADAEFRRLFLVRTFPRHPRTRGEKGKREKRKREEKTGRC